MKNVTSTTIQNNNYKATIAARDIS